MGEQPERAARRRWGRRFLIWLPITLLIGSLAANVLLYRQFEQQYREHAKLTLDPIGLQPTFPPDSPTNAGSSDAICLMFGDSRALQWPAPLVRDYRFVNRGVGGQTTMQVRSRFDAHVTPLNPKVVVIEAGINDLKTLPLFPERREQIVTACKENLKWIVEQATAGGARVVLVTIFPPGDVPLARRPVWSDEVEKSVVEVNDFLRSLASDRVRILDAWTLLHDGNRLRTGYGLDTLHLNRQGYDLLNLGLAKQLEELR